MAARAGGGERKRLEEEVQHVPVPQAQSCSVLALYRPASRKILNLYDVSPPVANAYQAYFVPGPSPVFGNGKVEGFHFTN